MPAYDLALGSMTTSSYSILATRCNSHTDFIRHVGLQKCETMEVRHGDEVPAVHMEPPLNSESISAHAVGIADLSLDEVNQIECWIEKIVDEYEKHKIKLTALRQYIVHPPILEDRDPISEVYRYTKYSCAGFVLDAYRQIEIELLDWSRDDYPDAAREALEPVFPEITNLKDHLERFGLTGEGPWKVVLPSHVMNALNRSVESIRNGPHLVQSGDERFPSPRP